MMSVLSKRARVSARPGGIRWRGWIGWEKRKLTEGFCYHRQIRKRALPRGAGDPLVAVAGWKRMLQGGRKRLYSVGARAGAVVSLDDSIGRFGISARGKT